MSSNPQTLALNSKEQLVHTIRSPFIALPSSLLDYIATCNHKYSIKALFLNKQRQTVVTKKMVYQRFKLFLHLITFLLLSLGAPSIFAEAVFHDIEGWAVDPPEGWQVSQIDPKQGYTVMSSGDEQCIAQIYLFDKSGNEDPKVVSQKITGALKATEADGGTAIYPWRDRRVVLSDLAWQNQGFAPSRGYLLCATRSKGCLAILVSCPSAKFDAYHPYMISFLDSLSVDTSDWNRFGPISAMLQEGQVVGKIGIETNQDLIEREAALLSAYTEVPQEMQLAAWERYYRMIYRDSFDRLADFATAFRAKLLKEKVKADQHIAKLAAYIQEFNYTRLDTLSDLLSPLAAIEQKNGDCDTRGLVFMITLRHWGIASIMMVSPKHQHSLVGIDVQGQGARYPFNKKTYLIAELNAKVALGKIEETMSASADWFGMNLEFTPESSQ